MSQHISVFYRTINKWVQKRYTFTAHRFPSLKIAALAFVQVRIYLHSQILNYGAESEINFCLRQPPETLNEIATPFLEIVTPKANSHTLLLSRAINLHLSRSKGTQNTQRALRGHSEHVNQSHQSEPKILRLV